MRIISSFHDFYDGVMKQGMDREVVYVRETKEVLIKDDFEVHRHQTTDYSYSLRYIGFCGKAYKFATIWNTKTGFCYYYHDLEEFKRVGRELGLLSNYDLISRWWKGSVTRFLEEDPKSMLEFFHKYQTPVFLVEESNEKNKQKLILNPNLKKCNFQTVKDAYSTYQEIFQFVAGTLNKPENKMVKISDKDKVAKHGYNKWSFRKLPTKKK